jgi:hypothetical protein
MGNKTNKSKKSKTSAKTNETSHEVKRRVRVDYDAFSIAWNKATSVPEVAKMFDMKLPSASALANRLREKGVNLKKFPRRRAQTVDVKALNKKLAGR